MKNHLRSIIAVGLIAGVVLDPATASAVSSGFQPRFQEHPLLSVQAFTSRPFFIPRRAQINLSFTFLLPIREFLRGVPRPVWVASGVGTVVGVGGFLWSTLSSAAHVAAPLVQGAQAGLGNVGVVAVRTALRYTVKSGDVLDLVSRLFDTTSSAFQQSNPNTILDIGKIYTGRQLTVPNLTVTDFQFNPWQSDLLPKMLAPEVQISSFGRFLIHVNDVFYQFLHPSPVLVGIAVAAAILLVGVQMVRRYGRSRGQSFAFRDLARLLAGLEVGHALTVVASPATDFTPAAIVRPAPTGAAYQPEFRLPLQPARPGAAQTRAAKGSPAPLSVNERWERQRKDLEQALMDYDLADRDRATLADMQRLVNADPGLENALGETLNAQIKAADLKIAQAEAAIGRFASAPKVSDFKSLGSEESLAILFRDNFPPSAELRKAVSDLDGLLRRSQKVGPKTLLNQVEELKAIRQRMAEGWKADLLKLAARQREREAAFAAAQEREQAYKAAASPADQKTTFSAWQASRLQLNRLNFELMKQRVQLRLAGFNVEDLGQVAFSTPKDLEANAGRVAAALAQSVFAEATQQLAANAARSAARSDRKDRRDELTAAATQLSALAETSFALDLSPAKPGPVVPPAPTPEVSVAAEPATPPSPPASRNEPVQAADQNELESKPLPIVEVPWSRIPVTPFLEAQARALDAHKRVAENARRLQALDIHTQRQAAVDQLEIFRGTQRGLNEAIQQASEQEPDSVPFLKVKLLKIEARIRGLERLLDTLENADNAPSDLTGFDANAVIDEVIANYQMSDRIRKLSDPEFWAFLRKGIWSFEDLNLFAYPKDFWKRYRGSRASRKAVIRSLKDGALLEAERVMNDVQRKYIDAHVAHEEAEAGMKAARRGLEQTSDGDIVGNTEAQAAIVAAAGRLQQAGLRLEAARAVHLAFQEQLTEPRLKAHLDAANNDSEARATIEARIRQYKETTMQRLKGMTKGQAPRLFTFENTAGGEAVAQTPSSSPSPVPTRVAVGLGVENALRDQVNALTQVLNEAPKTAKEDMLKGLYALSRLTEAAEYIGDQARALAEASGVDISGIQLIDLSGPLSVVHLSRPSESGSPAAKALSARVVVGVEAQQAAKALVEEAKTRLVQRSEEVRRDALDKEVLNGPVEGLLAAWAYYQEVMENVLKDSAHLSESAPAELLTSLELTSPQGTAPDFDTAKWAEVQRLRELTRTLDEVPSVELAQYLVDNNLDRLPPQALLDLVKSMAIPEGSLASFLDHLKLAALVVQADRAERRSQGRQPSTEQALKEALRTHSVKGSPFQQALAGIRPLMTPMGLGAADQVAAWLPSESAVSVVVKLAARQRARKPTPAVAAAQLEVFASVVKLADHLELPSDGYDLTFQAMMEHALTLNLRMQDLYGVAPVPEPKFAAAFSATVEEMRRYAAPAVRGSSQNPADFLKNQLLGNALASTARTLRPPRANIITRTLRRIRTPKPAAPKASPHAEDPDPKTYMPRNLKAPEASPSRTAPKKRTQTAPPTDNPYKYMPQNTAAFPALPGVRMFLLGLGTSSFEPMGWLHGASLVITTVGLIFMTRAAWTLWRRHQSLSSPRPPSGPRFERALTFVRRSA